MAVDADTATVYATLSANIMFTGGILLFFELSRGNRDVYSPRLRNNEARTAGKCPKGWFGWIPHTLAVSDEDTLMMIGMDAFVVLRFTKLCVHMCMVCMLGAVIMMTLYYLSPQQDGVLGINRYTMANIPFGGSKLYCAVFFSWFYSMLFVYLIKTEYKHFVYLRQRFMTSGDPDMVQQRLLTIQVENIPTEHQSDGKLYRLFNDLFPGDVYTASCCQFAAALDALVVERDAIVARFEVCLGYECTNDKSVQGDKGEIYIDLDSGAPPALYGGVKYSKAIQYFCSILIKLNSDIAGMQTKASAPDAAQEASQDFGKKGIRMKTFVPMKELLGPLLAPSAHVNHADYLDPEDQSSFHKGVGKVKGGIHKGVGKVKGGIHKGVETVKGGIHKGVETVNKRTGITVPVVHLKDLHLPPVDLNALALDYSIPVHGATGFVTFKTRRAHALAYQVAMITNQFPKMVAMQAPEPRDVVWRNVTVPLQWNLLAKSLTSVMYYAGMVFWTAILAFIAALSNLDNISKYVPALKHIDPVMYAFLAGLLPVVVLMLFEENLPKIMGLISEYFEKLKSRSEIARHVFRWFFYYQLSNIYLLLITGSVANSISAAIESPVSIFYLLGAAIPSISLFFTNYLITTVLFGVPFQLLLLYPQITHWFFTVLADHNVITRRQLLEGPLADISFDYGADLPNLLYVLCIVMTYWTMCPLLSIIGAFYFVGTYVVYKHQFLYVFTREFETGGQFWYKLFDSSMLSLVISCTLITAYVSVKGGITQASLLLPLPVTVWYCWRSIAKKYEHGSANMAFNCAVSSSDETHEALLATLSPDCYKQPCMKPDAIDEAPYPHRLEEVPLLTKESGHSEFMSLHSIYAKDVDRSFEEIEAFYRRLAEKYFPESSKKLDRDSLVNSHRRAQTLLANMGSLGSGGQSSPDPNSVGNYGSITGVGAAAGTVAGQLVEAADGVPAAADSGATPLPYEAPPRVPDSDDDSISAEGNEETGWGYEEDESSSGDESEWEGDAVLHGEAAYQSIASSRAMLARFTRAGSFMMERLSRAGSFRSPKGGSPDGAFFGSPKNGGRSVEDLPL
jgi:hypothetical protein